jgi:hypothetical protein
LEGHYNITEIDLNASEPLEPKANAKKFVNYVGVVVRDRVRSASMNGKRGRMILAFSGSLHCFGPCSCLNMRYTINIQRWRSG